MLGEKKNLKKKHVSEPIVTQRKRDVEGYGCKDYDNGMGMKGLLKAFIVLENSLVSTQKTGTPR